MSKVPPDHLVYLRCRPFAFRCATSVFPADELDALTEYGNWLEVLATGAIRPVTPEQEHFLWVDRDEAEPETTHERAWLRLKGRRETSATRQIRAAAGTRRQLRHGRMGRRPLLVVISAPRSCISLAFL